MDEAGRPLTMELEGSRLLFFDTFRDGFGVVRFSQPVNLTELRIVPRGAKLFTPADQLLGSTHPQEFALKAYVHLPPSTIGTFSKPASMLPLLFEYDGTAQAINAYRLELPTSTNSRMLVIRGDFKALTVVLYGFVKGQGPAPPPRLPESSSQMSRGPSANASAPPDELPPISLGLPVKPDAEDIARLLKQRPPIRSLDIDPFQDAELELAVSVFDGDRSALAAAISRCLDVQDSGFGIGSIHEEKAARAVSWSEALNWSATRVGKMTERELDSIANSLLAQDWMLDDDRPDWVNTRRMAKVVQLLSRHSSGAAMRLLTPEFLERTMILACESTTSSSRLAFLSETLTLASDYPAVFMSLINLPSYPAFIALQSPARETLNKRRGLVQLLSSPLADEDDIYTLADCAVPSDTFSAETVVRYLRHFDFLAALEPILIDVDTSESAEPIIHVLAALLTTAAGRLYLAKHLQEPGVLGGRLVDIATGRSVGDALWALRRLRLRQSIEEPRNLCKAMLAVICVTAIAAGLNDPVAFSACACLRTLANDGACAPMVTFVLGDKTLVAGLLEACQISIAPTTAWALLELFLRDPLLHLHPASILDPIDVAGIPDVPLSIQALFNTVRADRTRARKTGSFSSALVFWMAAIPRRHLASQPEAAIKMIASANAVCSEMKKQTFVLEWAVAGGRALESEVLRILGLVLDAVDDLMAWSCNSAVGELTKLVSAGQRCQTLDTLLELMDVSLRMLSPISAEPFTWSVRLLTCLFRALFLFRCDVFDERTWPSILAKSLASTTLSRLSECSPSLVLAAVENTLNSRPRLYGAAADILRALMPVKPSAEWSKACAGHLELFLALSAPSLLEQVARLDEGSKGIGLRSMLEDMQSEYDQERASTHDMLLLLEQFQEDGDRITLLSGGAEFSSKSYHGDAFRLQANEKLNLARPPSMHVDLYQGSGTALTR